MEKLARSLSSSVGLETGLSSRSGCGEALDDEASPVGEVAMNGRCAAIDLRRFENADSAI